MRNARIGTLIIAIFLLSTSIAVFSPIAYSSKNLEYDPIPNKCIVYPTGEDDTSNLLEAFDTVIIGGAGGEVQLVEGIYTISSEIVVVNFDGWFHGAGKEKTVIENEYTEFWPHREVGIPVAGLFQFYMTDDVPRSQKFSDMTIKVHGRTHVYFDQYYGMNVFDINGKVDGDLENMNESEVNTVFERMHFEGEYIDAYHIYNVVNTINIAGEYTGVGPSTISPTGHGRRYKPICGLHVVRDCSFNKVGAGIKYCSLNGIAVVENNNFEDVAFGVWLYDPFDLGEDTMRISDNYMFNITFASGIDIMGSDCCIITDNVVSESFGDGVYVVGSNHVVIVGNNITECVSGIDIEGSSDSVVFNNYVKGNGIDLSWDGVGDNLWLRNDYDTASYGLVDENEVEIGRLENLVEDLRAENSSLQVNISDLQGQVESFEDQVESLEGEVSSMLTYSTVGVILIISAIIFGVIGFLAAKRM